MTYTPQSEDRGAERTLIKSHSGQAPRDRTPVNSGGAEHPHLLVTRPP